MPKKPARRRLTPTQRRVQDALRVIVEWQREILKQADRPLEARRSSAFWSLMSYIEEIPIGKDLPRRWFELAEEALLQECGMTREAQERHDKLLSEWIRLGAARSMGQRKSARSRGAQIAASRKPEHDRWQLEAERLWARFSHWSAFQVAETIQGGILRKEGKRVGIRTITNRIRKPT